MTGAKIVGKQLPASIIIKHAHIPCKGSQLKEQRPQLHVSVNAASPAHHAMQAERLFSSSEYIPFWQALPVPRSTYEPAGARHMLAFIDLGPSVVRPAPHFWQPAVLPPVL